MISGMVTATALTLLVVPVLYTLLDDARMVVRTMVLKLFAPRLSQ